MPGPDREISVNNAAAPADAVLSGCSETRHKAAPGQPFAHGIVTTEAILGGPSKGDFDSMARRRYQKPAPRREGQQWVIYYWGDEFVKSERRRKRKRHVLGPASLGEREAEKVRDEFLRPINQGLVKIGSATKFEDYVESVYKPVVLPTMAKSTCDRTMSVYVNYLRPAFGEVCLRDITPLTVQRYVSDMAGWKLSQESKDKVRDVLSSILGSAVTYRLLIYIETLACQK